MTVQSPRHQAILDRLEGRGRVRIGELSGELGVSEMTIRRDLETLEREGALQRVHGGATSIVSSSYEPPYAARAHRNADGKRAAAVAAARLVRPGDTCVVDGGSTGVELARALAGAERLTVCTPSYRVASVLADAPGVRLMLTGGLVRPGELSLVGDLAEGAFRDLRFDWCFLSCSGCDAAEGVTEWNLDDARVKRAAVASARRVVVVLDAGKLGRTAFARVCPIDAVDLLVTDASASADDLAAFDAAGVETIVEPGAPT